MQTVRFMIEENISVPLIKEMVGGSINTKDFETGRFIISYKRGDEDSFELFVATSPPYEYDIWVDEKFDPPYNGGKKPVSILKESVEHHIIPLNLEGIHYVRFLGQATGDVRHPGTFTVSYSAEGEAAGPFMDWDGSEWIDEVVGESDDS